MARSVALSVFADGSGKSILVFPSPGYQALVSLRGSPPSSMAELRATITSLARRMNAEEVKKSVNNVSKRAKACIAVNGDNFEHLLKKARRAVEE